MWFFRLTVLLVIAVSFYFVYNWIGLVPERLANWWVNSQVEPQPVWGALQLAQGLPLYTDYRTTIPAVPITYGVLFYWIPAVIARIAHHPTPQFLLITGRCLSLTGFVAALSMIYLLARQRGTRRIWALAALLPLWWIPWVTEWSTKFMPDTTALFFSLAGWWVTGLEWKSKRSGFIIAAIAGVMFAAAFHIKAICIAGQVGCFVDAIWLVMKRDKTRASVHLAALAFYGALVLATFLLLQWATGGLYSFNLVETARQCSWKPRYLISRGPWELPVAVIATIIGLRRTPLAWILAIVSFITFGLMAKQGGGLNYLTASMAIWGLCLGQWAEESWGKLFWTKLPLGLHTVTVLLILLVLRGMAPYSRVFGTEAAPVPEASVDALRPILLHSNQKTLCLIPWLSLLWNLPLIYADPYHASLLNEKGINHLDAVVKEINLGHYAFVATTHTSIGEITAYDDIPAFPLQLARALRAHYEPYLVLGFVVWQPQTKNAALSAK
jgi:hypothetical protein